MKVTKTLSDPSSRLQESLRSSVQATLETPCPILVHINADTTWILHLPYPVGTTKPLGRSRYNILIDPWLRGKQSDVAPWFSCQWHTIKSSVQTIADLNELLRSSEALIQGDFGQGADGLEPAEINYIDAVIVSHEFTDHCHKKTLLELDAATPIFATSGAAQLIKSWKHFDQIIETPPFSHQYSNWRMGSSPPLPHWIGISRVVSEKDALYYHSAISIIFDLGRRSKEIDDQGSTAETVVYTPHGINARDLRCLATANPPVRTLALLHGLHDIRISMKQLNLGAHNGLQAQRICNAKYWVSTHDEVKKARGLITPVLFRRIFSFREALDQEKGCNGGRISDGSELAEMAQVNFADLKSGESLLLA